MCVQCNSFMCGIWRCNMDKMLYVLQYPWNTMQFFKKNSIFWNYDIYVILENISHSKLYIHSFWNCCLYCFTPKKLWKLPMDNILQPLKKTRTLHTWSFCPFFRVQIEASMQLAKFWFLILILIFSQLLCNVFCMIWLNTNIYMFCSTLCMFFACWFSISS